MKLNFPKIPHEKIYKEKLTPEQEVTQKYLNGEKLTKKDERILIRAINYYKQAYSYLKKIDLSNINDTQAKQILEYLRQVFNHIIVVQQNLTFDYLYRITPAKEEYTDKGKIRDMKYIKYPPLEIINEKGVYGRANTPNSNCFYCSFRLRDALLEVQPSLGHRIIITKWLNCSNKKFIAYPLGFANNIPNENSNKAKKGFLKRMESNHPLFSQIVMMQLNFLCSEFIKRVEMISSKNYEWLYSAFFANRILKSSLKKTEHKTLTTIYPYNGIIFPSVANQHRTDNLAIIPKYVDEFLRPIYIEDAIVTKTNYDEIASSSEELPIERCVLRVAKGDINNKIIWNDD